MFFVLYDRYMKSIGETYIAESWRRVKRAVDFDEMKVVGAKIPYEASPFFVAVNDKHGKPLFSGLASFPQIDEKTQKTSLVLKDYATLWNTDVMISWDKFTGNFLSEYISFILNEWIAQTDVGFSGIGWDVSDLSYMLMDSQIAHPSGVTESYSVRDLIFNALTYYGLYYDAVLDPKRKTLVFRFTKAMVNNISIRLSDFDVLAVEKSFGEYNRATVYDHNRTISSQWALTEDNLIEQIPSGVNYIYPAKNKNFVSKYSPDDAVDQEKAQSALFDATYDAVMGLAQNRYQETVELNVVKHKSVRDLTEVDFSYGFSLYTGNGFYRTLPVGEIEMDSKGIHLVRLGYRVQELTQEI